MAKGLAAAATFSQQRGIIGIGSDLAVLSRFSRFVDHLPREKLAQSRFAQKILHPAELHDLMGDPPVLDPARFLATKWASKEAVFKACLAYRGCGLLFPNIRVAYNKLDDAADGSESGETKKSEMKQMRPVVRFTGGETQAYLNSRSIDRVLLSITHDGDYVHAVCVAEGLLHHVDPLFDS